MAPTTSTRSRPAATSASPTIRRARWPPRCSSTSRRAPVTSGCLARIIPTPWPAAPIWPRLLLRGPADRRDDPAARYRLPLRADPAPGRPADRAVQESLTNIAGADPLRSHPPRRRASPRGGPRTGPARAPPAHLPGRPRPRGVMLSSASITQSLQLLLLVVALRPPRGVPRRHAKRRPHERRDPGRDAHRPGSGPGPGTHGAPRPVLRRVRRIGFLALGLKLAGFAWWSTLLYQHFALTPDFAQYQQAWYLIAHGHLNPYDTVGNFPFWQNHAEFIMWPLALLYWLFPSGLQLLWLQDIGVVGAEAGGVPVAVPARRAVPAGAGRALAGRGRAGPARGQPLVLVVGLVRLPRRMPGRAVHRAAGLGPVERPPPGLGLGAAAAGLRRRGRHLRVRARHRAS